MTGYLSGPLLYFDFDFIRCVALNTLLVLNSTELIDLPVLLVTVAETDGLDPSSTEHTDPEKGFKKVWG